LGTVGKPQTLGNLQKIRHEIWDSILFVETFGLKWFLSRFLPMMPMCSPFPRAFLCFWQHDLFSGKEEPDECNCSVGPGGWFFWLFGTVGKPRTLENMQSFPMRTKERILFVACPLNPCENLLILPTLGKGLDWRCYSSGAVPFTFEIQKASVFSWNATIRVP